MGRYLVLWVFFMMALTLNGQAFDENVFVKQAIAADEKATDNGEETLDDILSRPTRVQLDPIVIPILSDNGDVQVVSIVVAIEVPNGSSEDTVRQNSVRLVDAFLTDMYGLLDRNRLIRNGFLDIERIKKRLAKISQKMLGEDVVADVLLQAVQQRKV